VAATLQPDLFYDLVRGQCLEDGTFTNIMPLWGDFVIKPDASDYATGLRACTPLYQVAPNKITLTRITSDPLVLQFLYEERPEDVDRETGVPSLDWITHYLDSFRRLQQNVRGAAKVGKLCDKAPEYEGSGESHSTADSSQSRERHACEGARFAEPTLNSQRGW
jgi:hypothetical protein